MEYVKHTDRLVSMLECVKQMEKDDQQVLIEQLPQMYMELKHRYEVADSDLDNEMCVEGSAAIFKSEYHNRYRKKLNKMEIELKDMAMIYQEITGQDIENVIKRLSAEELD